MILAYGRNILKEAMNNQLRIQEIYIEKDADREFLKRAGVPSSIPVKLGIPNRFKKENHQGVAFKADHEFYAQDLHEFPDRVLLCNHLEDVQNLGSICRSAAAFGFKLIVHESKRSVRFNETALRISAGLAFKLKFMEVSNLVNLIKSLQNSGFLCVGLAAEEGSISVYDSRIDPGQQIALVVGSESKGISRPVSKLLDESWSIPMQPEVESLNASLATGIAMSWVNSFSKD